MLLNIMFFISVVLIIPIGFLIIEVLDIVNDLTMMLSIFIFISALVYFLSNYSTFIGS